MTEEGITGNKGEWSEFYVLLKVLGDGRIYGADGDARRKPDTYLDVNRVIRHDAGNELVFARIPEKEMVRVLQNGREYTEIVIPAIIDQYRRLFLEIERGRNSFRIPDSEAFMRRIGCTVLKAPSTDKTDITIEVHEPRTGMDLVQGFSIKSLLGSASTLLNASRSTNFIFALDGGMTEEIASCANAYCDEGSSKDVAGMLGYLAGRGIGLRFIDTEERTLRNNLMLIDSLMPEIVGEMLKLYYAGKVARISDQIRELNSRNPLRFRNPDDVPYYEYKIKKLLVSFALGMKPKTPWLGVEEANGGYIIVKKDGDVLYYHIFDRGSFEEYLVRNTKLDTPSVTRHGFAHVYRQDGEYRLKLNMQIRFLRGGGTPSPSGIPPNETLREKVGITEVSGTPNEGIRRMTLTPKIGRFGRIS